MSEELKVTGAQVKVMLEEIVFKVTEDWSKKLAHLADRNRAREQEIRDLRARVARLEKIIDLIGRASLQERP